MIRDLTEIPLAIELPLGPSEVEFERLVRLTQKRIHRTLLAWTGDPDVADTLTQECFLRAWKMRHSFRGESGLESWLLSIALNLVRDHRKSRRTGFWRKLLSLSPFSSAEDESVPGVPGRGPSPEEELLVREEMDHVNRVLATVSARQREAFHLRFVEDLPIQEIAKVMGLTVGSVKVHLARAIGALRADRERRE